jgi:phosphoadenosine phosphosulfate reductase
MTQLATKTLPSPVTWHNDGLALLNQHFRERPPVDLLRWAAQIFGDQAALGTGFGPSGVVLLHLASQIRPRPTFFYLDTGLLFAETYQLRDELARRLNLTFVPVKPTLTLAAQARRHGDELWATNPDQCCALRKVEPLRCFLTGYSAWITGIRRDQSPTRGHTPLLAWNHSHQVVKLNPLAYWTESMVWDYLRAYDLPYNRLHDQGYPSLGCLPCTRAIQPGEDVRAGRWAGHNKLECGIHFENGRVVRSGG